MKYRFFIFGFAAVLFAACAVNEEDHSTPAIETEEEFHATIEGDSTRVFVDDLLRVRWNADDRVSIFNRTTYNRQYRFDGQDGDNSGSFSKVPTDVFVTSNPLDYVYSVYPYSENTRITDDGAITVYLPAEQSYREDSFGLGANTMIAVADDNELMFKNLCGYIMLKLYGNDVSVSSISLKGNNNEPLAGKATVVALLEGIPMLSFDESATKTITLKFNNPVVLGTTEETATTFWLVVPPTVFSGGFTLTVEDIWHSRFEKTTTKSFEVQRNTLSKMLALQVGPFPAAVDLGLSVKWASCNVGASSPEEYGDYFAWGETDPKKSYDWNTYKWCNGTYNSLTKYNLNSSLGVVDNKTRLESEDDAAHMNWGSSWRMPTDAEWSELRQNCTWENVTQNGVKGRLVTSKIAGYTDQSIFLPYAGHKNEEGLDRDTYDGDYWTSSLSNDVIHEGFSCDDTGLYTDMDRYYGLSVRPVYVGQVEQEHTGAVIITNADEFIAWAADATADAELAADITLPAGFAPVASFAGVFDGKNHTITYNYSYAGEVRVSDHPEVADHGLIKVLTGQVRNLKVAGSIQFTPVAGTGTFHIGGIVGKTDGDKAVIENCENSMNLLATTKVIHYMGGIVGYTAPGATIKGCTNKGKVEMIIPEKAASNASQLGGIVGHIEGRGLVENCTNDGQVTFEADGTPRTAGMCGYVNNATEVTFRGCVNNAPIVFNSNYSGTSWSYVGGITGYYSTPVDGAQVLYENCTNNGKIELNITEEKSKTRAAGICAHGGKISTADATFTWTLKNCVNNGDVVSTSTTARNYLGGMIGYCEVSAKVVCDGCSNNARIATAGNGTVGAFLGRNCSVASTFTNFTVGAKTCLEVGTEDGFVGLVCGWNPALTTAITGKVLGGSVTKAGTKTDLTADNFADFVVPNALGEGGSTEGVIFEGSVLVPEAIDLGLSVKWASFNLGASKPEEYGDYYAWGETIPKEVYNWSTYKWCNGSSNTLTKYNTNSSYGSVDNKMVLDLEDDAAHVALGGKWRMPTDAEWTELRNNCTWTWTSNYNGTGVAGRIVTSKVEGHKDKSIFLPAAGYRYDTSLSSAGSDGFYWSSALLTDSPSDAWNVNFYSDSVDRSNSYRCLGHSVRPVSE